MVDQMIAWHPLVQITILPLTYKKTYVRLPENRYRNAYC